MQTHVDNNALCDKVIKYLTEETNRLIFFVGKRITLGFKSETVELGHI